jgi:hypothetical protein
LTLTAAQQAAWHARGDAGAALQLLQRHHGQGGAAVTFVVTLSLNLTLTAAQQASGHTRGAAGAAVQLLQRLNGQGWSCLLSCVLALLLLLNKLLGMLLGAGPAVQQMLRHHRRGDTKGVDCTFHLMTT